MGWAEDISQAVNYIEEHITDEELKIMSIAGHVNISPFYFQKGFAILCGCTVGEYIRKRRLALAGSELTSTDEKVIDIALKYGYDSPDSFSKAFCRFHGITPAAARKEGATIKSFAPLKIRLSLEGGNPMDYKIVKKDSFTVIGYENAKKEVPEFWTEHYAAGDGQYICGMYGVNHDADMTGEKFDYMIADNYDPTRHLPERFATKVIPAHTWAVFPCRGAMPHSLQNVNTRIFEEWLPACRDYEFSEGYCIEMYDDIRKYENGTKDENYYSEIWIPVRKK